MFSFRMRVVVVVLWRGVLETKKRSKKTYEIFRWMVFALRAKTIGARHFKNPCVEWMKRREWRALHVKTVSMWLGTGSYVRNAVVHAKRVESREM